MKVKLYHTYIIIKPALLIFLFASNKCEGLTDTDTVPCE